MMRLPIPILCCLLLGLLSTGIRAATIDAPVLADGTAFIAQAQAGGRCFAADVDTVTKGTLLNGSSQTPLTPGRYRLHVPLALAPLGNLRISEIAVTMSVGGAARTVKVLHFPQPDAFTDTTVDFTVTGDGHAPYMVSWAITGPLAEKLRERTKTDPTGPDPDDDPALDNLLNLPKPAEDGTIAIKELPKLPFHLAALKPYIEPLGSLAVDVQVDKIVYKPGETGAATVSVTNLSAAPATVALALDVRAGVNTRLPVATATLEIPAGEQRQWKGAFPLTGITWGAELYATAAMPNAPAAHDRAIFAVAQNFWSTAIIAGTNYSVRFRDRALAEKTIDELRAGGYTGFESGFWAPDDFGDFTPDKELFFGGHLCYPGSIAAMRNYIEFAHQRGMAATLYSLITACSGPPAYELMRRHPDWFTAGEFFSDWFEHWTLMEDLKIGPMSVWPYASIAWGKSDGIVGWHAKETVEGHTMFGWDGTRYDVYDDTSPYTINSTKKIREQVEKQVPAYQFGYNTEISDQVKPESYPIMLSNGGLIMHEAPRNIADRNYLFSKYLGDALDYRDVIWPHGGHYGICYDTPAGYSGLEPYHPNNVYGTKLDTIYVCTLLLASGAHPFYSRMESQFGDFPAFALRYADFIWNNAMRPLKDAKAVVSFGEKVELMQWERLTRRLSLDGARHRLVLHLINPPGRDAAHDLTQKTRPPLRNIPITLTLPDGAKVDGIWALTPIPTPRQEAVPFKTAGKNVTLTMPETRFWTVLVVEYSGPNGLE